MLDRNEILCEYGECNSSRDLRGYIELLCGFPGSYEIDIRSVDGEEGILHCGDHTVQHALWRDLSGVDALSVILSWGTVKFRIEAVPVLPHATITMPLKGVFEEVGRRNSTRRWLHLAVSS